MTTSYLGQEQRLLLPEETPKRHYDLPPLWDGVPVAWKRWSRIDSTLAFHLPAEDLACDQCGAIDECDVTHGRRGRLINLMAARCRHCGHDCVTDLLTDETWDLGSEDYTDIGSEAPAA